MSARWRIAGWGLALLAVANAVVVVGLWWGEGIRDVHSAGSLLTSLGRITGLLGAYLALLALLLLARLPVLERIAGFDRLTVWHRWVGVATVILLVAHTVLVTAGYTVGDAISLPREMGRLI